MKIYVGNLPFTVTEEGLNKLFSPFGEIQSIKIITDRETGRPRGFGFVEMDNAAADAAIKALNKTEMEGRLLKVNQAEPKKSTFSTARRW
jgi:RNA recognition motif-containing protein